MTLGVNYKTLLVHYITPQTHYITCTLLYIMFALGLHHEYITLQVAMDNNKGTWHVFKSNVDQRYCNRGSGAETICTVIGEWG